MLRLRTLGRQVSNTSISWLRSRNHQVKLPLVVNPSSNFSSFEKFPSPNGSLYNKNLEKDSCGVGLVANMKKLASRQVVVDANEMLVSWYFQTIFHQTPGNLILSYKGSYVSSWGLWLWTKYRRWSRYVSLPNSNILRFLTCFGFLTKESWWECLTLTIAEY